MSHLTTFQLYGSNISFTSGGNPKKITRQAASKRQSLSHKVVLGRTHHDQK
jgi:hypothetical protein